MKHNVQKVCVVLHVAGRNIISISMTSQSTNAAIKIAKKYIEGKSLSDVEKLVLLYIYYKDLLSSIEDETEVNLELEEEIAASWVQALFENFNLTHGSIDLELAARSISGAAAPPNK